MYKKILFISIIVLIADACANKKWYSIEQQPTEPYALLNDGIYASGDYLRSAVVRELNEEPIDKKNNEPFKVKPGTHRVMIHCNETKGEYDSIQQDALLIGPINLAKKAKTLTLETDIGRIYRVQCVPYTHWWIEDTETGKVVSGTKPIK